MKLNNLHFTSNTYPLFRKNPPNKRNGIIRAGAMAKAAVTDGAAVDTT
jgi:hypothetical protein